ncbi:MAG: dTMP kinase [Christensenellaceae bacterium]
MSGKFVTFEGCEGSGKSTQLKLLKEYFEKNGIASVFAREPGGTEIGEKLRKIILDKNNVSISDSCEALLYASARAQLVDELLLPSLKQGKTVVLDRYVDSSFAYQGYARGLGIDFIGKINAYAMENCAPHLTVFLNIDPENAFRRKGGVDTSDRLELAGLGFHKKVYQGYLELSKKYPERIVSVDCSGTVMQTHHRIIQALKERNII